MPVNEKKSCLAQLEGEMQGAPVNGDTGYALAKEDKFCKYLHMAVVVLESPCASLKEMQILTGGMVYLASFRRVAMSCLNEIWRFLQKLAQDMKRLLIPPAVRREIALFIGVAPLLQIRFRNCISPIVTASDASETGGGVVASVSVTGYGLEASQRKVRGETPSGGMELRSWALVWVTTLDRFVSHWMCCKSHWRDMFLLSLLNPLNGS